MKKNLLVVLTLFCLSVGIVYAAGGSGPVTVPANSLDNLKPVTIILAHGSTPQETSTIYLEKWMTEVEAISGGKIKFKYYPSSQLGSLVELIDALETGTINMSKGDPSLMTSYLPEFGVLNFPFIIKDYAHAERVINSDVGKELSEKMAQKNNTLILAWHVNGFRNFCTKKPIRNVADCKNILLRSPEADVYMNTFKYLNMKPTPIPYGEMYTALQTGVVDGIETVPSIIYTGEYYKLAKYVCKSNHMISLNCVTVNKNFWAQLPQAYRDIIIQTLNKNQSEEFAEVKKSDDSYYALIQKGGGTITEWDNYQELVSLFTPFWSQMAAKIGGNAQKYIDKIKALNN